MCVCVCVCVCVCARARMLEQVPGPSQCWQQAGTAWAASSQIGPSGIFQLTDWGKLIRQQAHWAASSQIGAHRLGPQAYSSRLNHTIQPLWCDFLLLPHPSHCHLCLRHGPAPLALMHPHRTTLGWRRPLLPTAARMLLWHQLTSSYFASACQFAKI